MYAVVLGTFNTNNADLSKRISIIYFSAQLFAYKRPDWIGQFIACGDYVPRRERRKFLVQLDYSRNVKKNGWKRYQYFWTELHELRVYFLRIIPKVIII